MAGCFGKIMEEMFAYRNDMEPTLRRMGFYLGKYIYLLDAYEDVEKDVKNGNYNPFSKTYMMEEFQENTRKLLIMMLAECCREFEKLPIIKIWRYSPKYIVFRVSGSEGSEQKTERTSEKKDD